MKSLFMYKILGVIDTGVCVWGGYFTNILVAGFSTRSNIWTQSDLRSCKNKGSDRSKINENEKFIQYAFKDC